MRRGSRLVSVPDSFGNISCQNLLLITLVPALVAGVTSFWWKWGCFSEVKVHLAEFAYGVIQAFVSPIIKPSPFSILKLM